LAFPGGVHHSLLSPSRLIHDLVGAFRIVQIYCDFPKSKDKDYGTYLGGGGCQSNSIDQPV
ncbi:MAG: hypothetical protein AAFQ76_08910, partial [Cyanobacteria bacterium J06626_26]